MMEAFRHLYVRWRFPWVQNFRNYTMNSLSRDPVNWRVQILWRFFFQQVTKHGVMKCERLPKMFREECPLCFEFVNKVVVPRYEKRAVASAADLFLIEQLVELEVISLPRLCSRTCIELWHGKCQAWHTLWVLIESSVWIFWSVSWEGSTRICRVNVFCSHNVKGKVKAKSQVSALL